MRQSRKRLPSRAGPQRISSYGRQSPQGERPIRNAAESQTDGQSAGDSHSVAGDGTDITKDTAEAKTPDERRKAYRDLMEGEYKDLYTEDTQHLINQRFKETEDLREQNAKSQSVLRILMGRYNIEDGDLGKLRKAIEEDDAYWAGAADEAGMSVEQYKQFQKLKRQNAELVELPAAAPGRGESREADQAVGFRGRGPEGQVPQVRPVHRGQEPSVPGYAEGRNTR